MNRSKSRKKVLLIQMWFGKIPDHFKYHHKTTVALKNFDFLIVTDDVTFRADGPNYRVLRETPQGVSDRLFKLTGQRIPAPTGNKASDFKICLADLFEKECKNYAHVGFYDIDTLFGDIDSLVNDELGKHDFLTIGDSKFHNRLSGPFVIFENTKELRTAWRIPQCFEDLANPEKTECDEKSFSEHVFSKYKVKVVSLQNVNLEAGGKIEYFATWHKGKIRSMNREILLYHFYHKSRTRLVEVGSDVIVAGYDKVIANDFVWVMGFDQFYAGTAEGLLRSIQKYSNRPCLVYSVNFDWAIPSDLFVSGQFMVRRIDLSESNLDPNSRNTDVVNYKPAYMLDAIKTLPNSKFAFIDADCSVTANADSIRDYLAGLENYPLLNCHTHDDIVVYSKGETFNSLEILLKRMGFQRTVNPRRKANIMLFDKRSEWFFNEQLELYEQHKEKEPWIFALQDEDSANALLSKYEFSGSLPVIDIEESYSLDLSKYSSYSFGNGTESVLSKIPTHPNQVVAFHQVKSPEDFVKIDEAYGKTVIPQDEVVIEYRNNTLTWQRNMHQPSPELPQLVDFVVYSGNYKELYSLRGQPFRNYWFFCINSISLPPGIYPVKILNTETGQVIHSDLIEIQKSN